MSLPGGGRTRIHLSVNRGGINSRPIFRMRERTGLSPFTGLPGRRTHSAPPRGSGRKFPRAADADYTVAGSASSETIYPKDEPIIWYSGRRCSARGCFASQETVEHQRKLLRRNLKSSETVVAIPEPERKLLELMLEEGAPMIEYILGNMSFEGVSGKGAPGNL